MDWSSPSELERSATRHTAALKRTDVPAATRVGHMLALARVLHLSGRTDDAATGLQSVLTEEHDDESRTRMMAELAMYFAWLGRIGEAGSAAESALASSLRSPSAMRPHAEAALGGVAITVGNTHRAKQHLQTAAANAEDNGLCSDIFTGLTYVHLAEGHTDSAMAMARQSMESAHQAGHPWREQAAGCALGRVLLAKDDIGGAQTAFSKAHTQSTALQNKPGIAQALAGLGDTAIRRQRYVQSRQVLKESLKISTSTGWRKGAIRATESIAITHLRTGEPATAAQLLHRARELATNLGDPHLMVGLSSYLVDCYVALDRPERRIEVRKVLLDDIRVVQDLAAEASQLSAIGEDCVQVLRFADAERAFREALALSRERDDTWAQAIDLANLADLAQRQGDPVTWRSLMTEAQTLAPADSALFARIQAELD